MKSMEHNEIESNILKFLYFTWSEHSRNGVVPLDAIRTMFIDDAPFDAAVNFLIQRGMIEQVAKATTEAIATYRITPEGIFHAENSGTVPKSEAENHREIRNCILKCLSESPEIWFFPWPLAYGVLGYLRETSRDDDFLKQVEPTPDKTYIWTNLELLVDLGLVEHNESSFHITKEGFRRYSSAETDYLGKQSKPRTGDNYLANLLIIWDPEIVNQDDYVSLITALGDLVRSEGGIGVERIGHSEVGIHVGEGTLV